MSPVKTNVLVSLTEWRRDLGTGHGGACNVEKTELGAHVTVNYFPKLKNVSGTKKKKKRNYLVTGMNKFSACSSLT